MSKCLSDTVPVQVVVKLTTLYRQDNILFTYVPQGLIERPAMYMKPSAIHHGEPGSAIPKCHYSMDWYAHLKFKT